MTLPFFARYLEPQELEAVRGADTHHPTMKYPSDSDEAGAWSTADGQVIPPPTL